MTKFCVRLAKTSHQPRKVATIITSMFFVSAWWSVEQSELRLFGEKRDDHTSCRAAVPLCPVPICSDRVVLSPTPTKLSTTFSTPTRQLPFLKIPWTGANTNFKDQGMLRPICSDRVVLREVVNTTNIFMQHHPGAQHHHAAQHRQGAQGQQESQY